MEKNRVVENDWRHKVERLGKNAAEVRPPRWERTLGSARAHSRKMPPLAQLTASTYPGTKDILYPQFTSRRTGGRWIKGRNRGVSGGLVQHFTAFEVIVLYEQPKTPENAPRTIENAQEYPSPR